MPFVVRCEDCGGEEIVVTNLLREVEEIALRQHVRAVHPKAPGPATLGELLTHFLVTATQPPAA